MQQVLFDLTEKDIDLKKVDINEFVVKPVTIQEVKSFVEKWHYSRNINGLNISHVFGLFYKQYLIGAIIYGSLSMANTWQKYGTDETDVVELKRLCCIDATKKNTESFFIAKTIKFLKKYSNYKTIVSYADPYFKHQGTIYKASNFTHEGFTAKSKVILYKNKIYHDKTIRSVDDQKRLKPFTYEIKKALQLGQATYIDKPPKHIYCYEIKRKNDDIPRLKSLQYTQMSLV
tara:strand:+ start:32 stop:724 length:693 start_codon:yes stop_codon:yes gene_type:complete